MVFVEIFLGDFFRARWPDIENSLGIVSVGFRKWDQFAACADFDSELRILDFLPTEGASDVVPVSESFRVRHG